MLSLPVFSAVWIWKTFLNYNYNLLFLYDFLNYFETKLDFQEEIFDWIKIRKEKEEHVL